MTTPKQPQDHKKKTAVEREHNDFVWERNGHRVVLPPAAKIKAGVIRRASKLDGDVQQIFSVMEEIADPDSLAVMDDLTLDELGELFLAWQNHGGTSVGESQGSST